MLDPNTLYKSTDTPLPPIAFGKKLIEQQTVFGTIVGALSAGVPIQIIYVVTVNLANDIAYSTAIALSIILLSGYIVAYVARFCGRGFEDKYRVITAAIYAITIVFIHLWLLKSILHIFYTLPAIPICWYYGKRKLTPHELRAIIRWKQSLT